MKPKTKLEFRVHSLRKQLTRITVKHKRWAYEKNFYNYAYITKDKCVCVDCKHETKEPNAQFTCPNCGVTLTKFKGRERSARQEGYITVLDTCEEFQVVRHFYLKKYCKTTKETEISFVECVQHWISEKGKTITRSVGYSSWGYYGSWAFGEMEIKHENDKYYVRAPIYPVTKILPILIRNGFTTFDKLHPTVLFTWLLKDNLFETLLKTKQSALLDDYAYYKRSIQAYWAQIKICIRNNYTITNFGIWRDYLDLLTYFKKDINSPKYICITNLKEEHNRLVQKKLRIEELERMAERKRKLRSNNIKYKKEKSKFFDLEITNGDITITVLKNLQEFKKEGNIFNHCVYASEYYAKNSVILSARQGNKRLETIEVSLNPVQIVQCAGYDNKLTEHHNEIMKLMKRNLKQIKQVI